MIDLNKETLTSVIKNFGKEGKIFQSEAQFQFELAWKLQEQFPDCKVKLEDMRAYIKNDEKEKKKGFKKKFYTDIVIVKDDYSIAIELKYKTAEYFNNGTYLFGHDAVDEGRYDYLWDVHRIELLLGKGYKKEMLGLKEVTVDVLRCNKGLAVLLTNEKKYWEQSYEDGKDAIDDQFKIGEKTKKIKDKNLDWKKDEKKYPQNYMHYPSTVTNKDKPKDRAQPIHLARQYEYQWENYELPNDNGKFRFVIIEV